MEDSKVTFPFGGQVLFPVSMVPSNKKYSTKTINNNVSVTENELTITRVYTPLISFQIGMANVEDCLYQAYHK